MKNIGYKDVETYIRIMISEGFGSKAEDKNDYTIKRNKGAHAEHSSTSVQIKANKREKRSNVKE